MRFWKHCMPLPTCSPVPSCQPPLGTDEIVLAYPQTLSAQHRALLEAFLAILDLQVAWLPLLYCASPRNQHAVRALPLALTAAFACAHDRSVLRCKRPGSRDGRRCSQSQPSGHTRAPCWSSHLLGRSTAMKPCLTYRSCILASRLTARPL